jgi:hypothetical protein
MASNRDLGGAGAPECSEGMPRVDGRRRAEEVANQPGAAQHHDPNGVLVCKNRLKYGPHRGRFFKALRQGRGASAIAPMASSEQGGGGIEMPVGEGHNLQSHRASFHLLDAVLACYLS